MHHMLMHFHSLISFSCQWIKSTTKEQKPNGLCSYYGLSKTCWGRSKINAWMNEILINLLPCYTGYFWSDWCIKPICDKWFSFVYTFCASKCFCVLKKLQMSLPVTTASGLCFLCSDFWEKEEIRNLVQIYYCVSK